MADNDEIGEVEIYNKLELSVVTSVGTNLFTAEGDFTFDQVVPAIEAWGNLLFGGDPDAAEDKKKILAMTGDVDEETRQDEQAAADSDVPADPPMPAPPDRFSIPRKGK